jgi:hypothetical protein
MIVAAWARKIRARGSAWSELVVVAGSISDISRRYIVGDLRWVVSHKYLDRELVIGPMLYWLTGDIGVTRHQGLLSCLTTENPSDERLCRPDYHVNACGGIRTSIARTPLAQT